MISGFDDTKEAQHTPTAESVDTCQTPDCENDVFVDDYGVAVCESCLTPEIEAYLRRQAANDAGRW